MKFHNLTFFYKFLSIFDLPSALACRVESIIIDQSSGFHNRFFVSHFAEIACAVYVQSSGAYFADVVESHHMASMQTIMSSVTYGMGRGIGSLLGGGLFQTIATTRTYMMFAVVSFAFGLFLSAIHLILAIPSRLGFVDKGYDALRPQSDDR